MKILAERAFGARADWTGQIKEFVEDQFWCGISETLRVSFSFYDYKSYDELVQLARRVEMNTRINVAGVFAVKTVNQDGSILKMDDAGRNMMKSSNCGKMRHIALNYC